MNPSILILIKCPSVTTPCCSQMKRTAAFDAAQDKLFPEVSFKPWSSICRGLKAFLSSVNPFILHFYFKGVKVVRNST